MRVCGTVVVELCLIRAFAVVQSIVFLHDHALYRRYATVMSLLGLMRQAADHPAILTLMQYGGVCACARSALPVGQREPAHLW
jgi:hypothetical protein